MTNPKIITSVTSQLKLYTLLSQLKLPKSYLGKIMLVAFIGTHIPLLSLFFYAITVTSLTTDTKIKVLVVALIATLVGTGITLFTLQKLLIPITLTAKSLRQYLETNKIPQLPTKFKDEAGVLMADTQYSIGKLDELIQQLKNYDSLTALPNRLLFHRQLQQLISELPHYQNTLAIMLVDLDGFQNINNIFGHESGDFVLRHVSQKLSQHITKRDILARVSSDEFALVHSVTSVEGLNRPLAKLNTR
ncbi:diguanylate cyclase [Geminocystis sp. NIES-3709]|uniref:GGDEF domain-containing protein n=1 Tax=Geminocystis sp. NIES-3709 TaxID=1617448 RepID=UPI0005FCBB23|nr:diguanylate cyclase [Geminocystis sp. NIES-3709]BAQ63722.1 diguanylate cyclase/phosphodiesterase with PAS/PAC sensor [Geminocystis sp. NIES-3709]